MVMDMRDVKKCGIEWASTIPTTWKSKKAKFNFINHKYIPGIESDKYDRLSLTLNGVIPRSKDDAEGLQPKDFLTYQLLKPRELVFKLIDLQNISTSRVGLSHDTGLVSPAYIILSATGEILPEFAEKYFLMLWYRQIFNALGDNGVRSSLNVTDLLNIPICYPTIEEQEKIVSFLDAKCTEIDALSADIQSEIDTLEAYKNSVITEAVTKGLDKNVPMKDSGIPWIGNIPGHWSIYRIADLYCDRNERGNNELPLLTVSINTGVSDKELTDDEQERVFVRSEDKTKYKRVYVGDITYNMMRAWQGAFGAVRVNGMVSPAYVVAKQTGKAEIDSRYIEALLRSPMGIEEMNRYSYGIMDFRKRLYWPQFRIIKVCLPDYNEQRRIADYIDEQSKEIDLIIKNKKNQISILEEYKKSVIYEYVTGKKEVSVS